VTGDQTDQEKILSQKTWRKEETAIGKHNSAEERFAKVRKPARKKRFPTGNKFQRGKERCGPSVSETLLKEGRINAYQKIIS